MLGLLVLLLVAAIVSLLGEALVPRGMPDGLAWEIVAGTLGAALAAAIALLMFNLVARGLSRAFHRTTYVPVRDATERLQVRWLHDEEPPEVHRYAQMQARISQKRERDEEDQ
jgi:uncharacterized membrane protein YeaQ/YmgE (transglycosylase-associated protein family)